MGKESPPALGTRASANILRSGRRRGGQRSLVEHEQGRSAVEPLLQPMEKIGEHRSDRTCAMHERLGLEALNITQRQRILGRIEQAIRLREEVETDEDGDPLPQSDTKRAGFSSGERQLRALREIVRFTDAPIYLLDEWDANLSDENCLSQERLIERLAETRLVIEIRHGRKNS